MFQLVPMKDLVSNRMRAWHSGYLNGIQAMEEGT